MVIIGGMDPITEYMHITGKKWSEVPKNLHIIETIEIYKNGKK